MSSTKTTGSESKAAVRSEPSTAEKPKQLITLSKTLNVLTSISADEKFTTVSAYLLGLDADSYVFTPCDSATDLPKLTVSVDSKTGLLCATLERFDPSALSKEKSIMAVIVRDALGNYRLGSRFCNKKSMYPIINLTCKGEGSDGSDEFQLIWFHGGLFDQLNVLQSKSDIPLVIHNPPRLIDCRFSTTGRIEEHATSSQNKFYVILNRRARSPSQKDKLLECNKKRDREMPIGSEYYSITRTPCQMIESDMDSFLVAECGSLDCVNEYVKLYSITNKIVLPKELASSG